MILTILCEKKLKADITKCEFHAIKLSYFDLIVIIKEIKIDLIKVDIKMNLATSVNIKDI